jgi:hypothetical protein
MLGVGRDIDLDKAPITLRQSRTLSVGTAVLALFCLWLFLIAIPLSLYRPICSAPQVILALAFLFLSIDAIASVIWPETIVIGERGLMIRRRDREILLRWRDVGSIQATRHGVSFATVSTAVHYGKPPTLLRSYGIFSTPLAKALTQARHRWARDAPDVVREPASHRELLIIGLLVAAAIAFVVWAKSGGLDQCWG